MTDSTDSAAATAATNGASADAGAQGLLAAKAAEEAKAAAATTAASAAATNGDAGKTAKATRPDWLPEQFWDNDKAEPKIQDAIKSWKDTRDELKKAKGKEGTVPAQPEQYVYERASTLPAHIATDADKDSVKILQTCAHECGLTQDQFAKFANGYFQRVAEVTPPPPDPAAEKAKLGPNADKVVEAVFGWGKGLVNDGRLSPEEFDEMFVMGSTAAGVRALNKIRELVGGAPIPTNGTSGNALPSKEEVYAMTRTEKYRDDPAEQQRVTDLFVQVFGNAPAGVSPKGMGLPR